VDIKKLLGGRIQEIRKSKKITQEFLAENIGIETVSMSNIERGRYYPTVENLSKIIDVLEVQPEELFKFKHLMPVEDLIKEMNTAMFKDEKLTRLMYKFFKSVS